PETPAISVSGDDDIETSAVTRRATAADVLSSIGRSEFIADVSRIEQQLVEDDEKAPESVESVAGTAWREELERIERESERPPPTGLSFGPLFAPNERALIEQ